jgi:hypothetical protein
VKYFENDNPDFHDATFSCKITQLLRCLFNDVVISSDSNRMLANRKFEGNWKEECMP